MTLHITLCVSPFFQCRIVDFRKVRLNIKAGQALPEFLNTDLWSIHLITFNIESQIGFEKISFCTIFTLFPRTGHRLRSALHRIQFRTCCFVPMSYLYSETNEWLQDWAKQWALCGNNFLPILRKFHFQCHDEKEICPHCPISTKHQSFLIVELIQYRKSGSTFSSSEPVAARSQTSPSCAPRPAQAVQKRCPKSLAIYFAVKSFDCLLE